MKEQNSNAEENSGYTIQEASKKLSVPENTLRKYLAYFELKVEKTGRKNYLVEESMECLTQIIQLKSNGWSLKQIKDFMNKKNQQGSDLQSSDQSLESDDSEETEVASEDLQDDEESSNDEVEEETVENDNYEVQSSQSASDSEYDEVIEPISVLEQEPEERDDNLSVRGSLAENEDEIMEEPTKTLLRDDELQASDVAEAEEMIEAEQADHLDDSSDERSSHYSRRIHLTKDSVNKEIANQAKRASRLYRFLGSRNSARDTAEIKADLDRRVIFLNGLRYIRDNWLERSSNEPNKEKKLTGVN